MSERKLAAVFIDFENFYYSLTNLYGLSYEEASESALSIIGNSLDKLRNKLGEFVIMQAYADWTDLEEPKKELQKMGIRVFDILSSVHKSSADLELSLAIQEILLTREDIDTIVVFSGDRDYMPIALRIRERGKLVHFVGFRENLSGDLKKLIGDQNYSLVDRTFLTISENRQEAEKETESDGIKELDQYQRRAAIAAINAFDSYKEKYGSVRLSIFLTLNLAKALPDLPHLKRKEVFSSLEELGIVKTERKQSSTGYEAFAVFTIDEGNRIVKKLRKNIQEGERIFRDAVMASADENGNVLGARLGIELRRLDRTFSPAKYGCSNLAEVIDLFPKILTSTNTKQGEDLVYKIISR